MTSSLSSRDQRLRQWAAAVAPDDQALDPLPFEQPTASGDVIDRARKGLANLESLGMQGATLEKFVLEIRRERTTANREMNWPSLAEDKARLKRVLRHARALQTELAEMSMRVEVALNTEYHDSNGRREQESQANGEYFDTAAIDHVRLQEEQLPALVDAAVNALEGMPYQARPLAQVHLVDVVAKALEPFGIRPSKSETSKFHRACEAAFGIANIEVRIAGKSRPSRPSPTGSIRAYMSKRGRNSRSMW